VTNITVNLLPGSLAASRPAAIFHNVESEGDEAREARSLKNDASESVLSSTRQRPQ
jgi:hypothetical protein